MTEFEIDNFPAIADKQWVRACTSSDIPEDGGYRIDTTPPVSLFAAADEVFCIDDTCTHETYSLADGWVEDCTVECSLHMAKFCLRTGAPLSPPAAVAVAVHPVARVGDDLFIALPPSYLAGHDS